MHARRDDAVRALAGLIRGWVQRHAGVWPSHHPGCRSCPPHLPVEDVGRGTRTGRLAAPSIPNPPTAAANMASESDIALPALRRDADPIATCSGLPAPYGAYRRQTRWHEKAARPHPVKPDWEKERTAMAKKSEVPMGWDVGDKFTDVCALASDEAILGAGKDTDDEACA